ncbi:MAG: aminomethyl-transferring glycine dehydrogenase subunit GcvPB [Candidatus Eisenbacteria bacterium]|nr:aminomethyl-transferring glycine dehydrogenase subunit GcvPB [Candidatus Eisenbacteria bacterium]
MNSVEEKLIIELSSEGKKGYTLPELDVPEVDASQIIPSNLLREEEAELPQVSEAAAVRHFTRLSALNHHVDKGFYPLGSCTMKYNPKVNEETSSLPGFQGLHPLTPASGSQGALRLMYELCELLKEIVGMDAGTLQPAAGAHGELTAMLMVAAYHRKKKRSRKKVIVPDSAHGTNPASVALSGFQVVQVKSSPDGRVDLEELKKLVDDDVAALMLTNPNTLGLFEKSILPISELIHSVDGIMYLDGANLNALVGIVKPGDMGFDAVHINLHKTFSTPHGGGGPGSGPVMVNEKLEQFLPVPRVVSKEGTFKLDWKKRDSIGPVHSFYGNFGVLVKAFTYILMLGNEGLKEVSEAALVNANYLLKSLEKLFDVPYPGPCMHEFVLSGRRLKANGVRTLDVAKRLLDFGMHAPTIYFPLIVEEALMIEPTETEDRASLDAFIDALKQIVGEAERSPDILKTAPVTTPVRRLDEARAARELVLKWKSHRG